MDVCISICDKLEVAEILSVLNHLHSAHWFVSLEKQQVRMLVYMNLSWCVTDWQSAAVC